LSLVRSPDEPDASTGKEIGQRRDRSFIEFETEENFERVPAKLTKSGSRAAKNIETLPQKNEKDFGAMNATISI